MEAKHTPGRRNVEVWEQAYLKSLGSAEAVIAHDAVIDALQRFGFVTGALAGSNIIDWFRKLSDQADRAAFAAVDKTKATSPSDTGKV